MATNGEEKKIQVLSLKTQLEKQNEVVTSQDLPRNVSMQLYALMKEVTATGVNPESVKAACACATEIHRMLKLNLELKKIDL